MLNSEHWNSIVTAYQMVYTNQADRIDGKCWSVYRVGKIVRIDIKDE